MKYAIYTHTFDDFSNPAALADLAREAEESFWDGFFLWDVLHNDPVTPAGDPWIALAAIAAVTERIRIGPLVAGLARRRPWVVARQAVSLDHLSGGRMVLGAAIGTRHDYEPFGDPAEARDRAAYLDESLDIILKLWRGDPVTFEGDHYRLENVHMLPTPLQKPRIPVWIGGYWPSKPPFRRAARYDGVFPFDEQLKRWSDSVEPDRLADLLAYTYEHRSDDGPFDVVLSSALEGDGAEERLARYEEMGVTWWLDHFHPGRFDIEAARARIRLGPPRADE